LTPKYPENNLTAEVKEMKETNYELYDEFTAILKKIESKIEGFKRRYIAEKMGVFESDLSRLFRSNEIVKKICEFER